MAVISLAAIYAQEAMKFTSQQTIVLVLVVNITAAFGAFGFGYLQDAIGHVKSMTLVLIGWIIMIALAYFAESVAMFWVAANLAGLCMGAAQAAGRAIVGYLSPPARTAEFFGLWGLAVKAASIFGPLTYGAVTWIFEGNHRLGILAVGAYFVVGLILLIGIDVERGRRAALQATELVRHRFTSAAWGSCSLACAARREFMFCLTIFLIAATATSSSMARNILPGCISPNATGAIWSSTAARRT